MVKRLSLITLVILITLLLSSCRKGGDVHGAPADAGNLPDIVGVYGVNGVDANNVQYGGTLKIESETTPGHYRLHWIVTGAIQEGEGVVEGNQLKARWRNVEGVADAHGDVVYTITTLGELDGKRTLAGVDGEGWEKAFPNDEKWGRFKFGH